MGYYFDDNSSMAARVGSSVEEMLTVVAKHYMEQNPQGDVTFRAFSGQGIQRAEDYRYEADFNLLFPQAKNEQCVYAWAKMWSDGGELIFDLNCYGPLGVFLNGEEVWRSDIFAERHPEKYNRITLNLKEGWNHFVICSKKTRGGFGWKFGSWIGKHPYVFMMPTPVRDGREGWIFTNPISVECQWTEDGEDAGVDTALLNSILIQSKEQPEQMTGIRWNPLMSWSDKELALDNCERIYGRESGKTSIGWTKLKTDGGSVMFTGCVCGTMRVLCDGFEVFKADASGTVNGSFQVSAGTHDLMVLCTGCDDGWGFNLAFDAADVLCPCDLQGSDAAWLFAGPFNPDKLPDLEAIRNFFTIHATMNGPGYWRIDEPNTWLRLYNENPLFGQWNYPLGVTLYGLLHTAMALGADEIKQYTCEHVQFCCASYPYSVWDRDTFGGATHIHNLLSSIDSLDDCGSFGSCMLETVKYCNLEGFGAIAELVGDYIVNKQDRFEDGTFQRRKMMHAFHNKTMWADDLYMSVPFLCRYYQMTGDRRYIDDAANQFFGFKKRLYIPERRVMSHVYDIARGMATGVPWGRGNGWTLFSLSELLEVLPEDHEKRDELLAFFRELCEGIRALQDDEGMWHQVLTHPESYPETSCTSMFIYAFSRGIRHGWLETPAVYSKAVSKAWKAICRISVDAEGNVYGVCRGSEFSFTPDYYINDLSWRLNDTHGIGIVLLAGVEVKRLNEYCADSIKKEVVVS